MSVIVFATLKRAVRRLGAATVFAMIGAFAVAQTPTQDQLNAFKNLSQDQQNALLQSVLGNSDSTNGNKTDTKPNNTPETREQRDERQRQTDENKRKNKTGDGRTLRQSDENPELRADDSVLIDLTPIELATRDGKLLAPSTGATVPLAAPPNPPAQANTAIPANKEDNKSNSVTDFGRLQIDPKSKSTDELGRAALIRYRVLTGNPYKLNRFGVLELPGLPSIPLAGLTAEEATVRLSADPDLQNFIVRLTLLRLEPLGDEGAKPFGYDLFQGEPSTFAPVKDIQVPIDYIVGPGDTFNIQLYGNVTASYKLTVNRDGRIDFPKLGPISVSGMGFDAARAVLEHHVAQQLLGTQISVTMGDLRSIRVFVLGEAEKPGSYTVSGLSTMTNALFVSGGVKKIGSLREIELKRNGQLISVLDLYDLLLHGNTSGDRQLKPGDVIFIPPIGATETIYGAVRRPGVYEVKERKDSCRPCRAGGRASAGRGRQARAIGAHRETSRLRDMRNYLIWIRAQAATPN